MSEMKYRHEYKYLVSSAQIAALRARADVLLSKDQHICTEGRYAGGYNVRSVYFDDMNNSAYMDNEDGVDPREKFRIRIYNHSDDIIELELKCKQAGKCLKRSCPLTREQADILLSGQILPTDEKYPQLLQKLLVEMQTRMMHPVVIVEYDRIPYVYPIGNVRVTMDLNIRASDQFEKFFDDDLLFRPVLQTGEHMFEIKWDELLPDYIYTAMMLDNLQWTSFSKFYYSRHFMTSFIECP